MSYTDREIIKNRDAGRAQSYGCADPIGEVAKQNSYFVNFTKAADDGSASTATSEVYTGKAVTFKARLKSLRYTATTGGITASDADNATITIYKRDSAAANQLAIASLTTNVAQGSVVQGTKTLMTLTAANVIIDADSTITFAIAKTGSGVVVRAGEFTLELEAV